MKPDVILDYLTTISNKNIYVNMTMHLIVIGALLLIFFIRSEKLKSLIAYSTMIILSLSVAVHAFLYGNPFHLITFIVLAGFSIYAMYRQRVVSIPKLDVYSIIALLLIGIGVWYPEFVSTSAIGYLLFSPLGIVPCPTLLVTLGLLTLVFPKINKAHFIVLIVLGFIYGIIGTFVLKVYLDITLILAAIFGLINLIRLNRKEKN